MLVEKMPGDRELQHLMARLHFGLAAFLRDNDRLKEAEQAFNQSLALAQTLKADFPHDLRYRSLLARNQLHLGNLLGAVNRKGEAEKAFRDAVTTYEELLPNPLSIPNTDMSLRGPFTTWR